MVRVDANSVHLRFNPFPTVKMVPTLKNDKFWFELGGNKAGFVSCFGKAKLIGDSGESAAGWAFGFIQIEWINVNWAHYKGVNNEDGSLFVNYARPPLNMQTVSHDRADEEPNRIWYDDGPSQPDDELDGFHVVPAGKTVPHDLEKEVRGGGVVFADRPTMGHMRQLPNKLTGARNFLFEAQTAHHFCTIFSAREPSDGPFRPLASFYWACHWQARFDPKPDGSFLFMIRDNQGTGFFRSGVIPGPPSDPRFKDVVTKPTGDCCNKILRSAKEKVLGGFGIQFDRDRNHQFDVNR
jgi:hypothetical protein